MYAFRIVGDFAGLIGALCGMAGVILLLYGWHCHNRAYKSATTVAEWRRVALVWSWSAWLLVLSVGLTGVPNLLIK